MPVLKVRKSVKIWCSNSKISIFASPGKFSNMENIHTMAKKYPYGYEKKFPKIFDFRDMPCHKYFEWLVPCLLNGRFWNQKCSLCNWTGKTFFFKLSSHKNLSCYPNGVGNWFINSMIDLFFCQKNHRNFFSWKCHI